MASAQYLREFINERLTAAAEQIFLEFEKTIVQYEEEMERQRRLLDITWKPQIKLHRTDVPQQPVCKEEEVLPEQQLCDQERSSSPDQEEPEAPQIKEEQEEQEEQLVVWQQSDPFMVTATYTAHKLCERLSHVRAPLCHRRGKKSVKCDVCGKAFQHRSRMIKRRRIHTGVKPYACDTCGKGFARSDMLALHTRTHTGESAYTCGERFIQSAMLKTHTRSHTGETLDCKTCGRRFSQKSRLLRHMKIHTRKTKPA